MQKVFTRIKDDAFKEEELTFLTFLSFSSLNST